LREQGLLDVPDEVVRASTPLGAGFGFSRATCTALLAGGLALGLKYGRSDLSAGRKQSWSRASRLAERFRERFQTLSCEEITSRFSIPDFATEERITRCMGVIDFAARETAMILFEEDDTFSDPQKEDYFALREGSLRQPFPIR
jgi:C_GCAxxG_C_C family probable redox protein